MTWRGFAADLGLAIWCACEGPIVNATWTVLLADEPMGAFAETAGAAYMYCGLWRRVLVRH